MTGTAWSRPHFNHIGFTVPKEALNGDGRRKLKEFWGGCFGFEERPEFTKDEELLILMLGEPDQFMVLFGHDSPTLSNPPLDHFGMRCQSLEQLKAYLAKVKEFVAAGGEVEFQDYESPVFEDARPYRLHRFYVRAVLPFTFEIQYYEWLDDKVAVRKEMAEVSDAQ
jgi:hypothetical protein